MLHDPTEATSFWSKIWSEEVGRNERASWLEVATTEMQEGISITVEDIKKWSEQDGKLEGSLPRSFSGVLV